MLEPLWQDLANRFSTWTGSWLTPAALAQLLVLGLCLLLALLLRRLLTRPLSRLGERIGRSQPVHILPGLSGLVPVLARALVPLLVWALFSAAIRLSENAGQAHALLVWARPFAVIWSLYLLVHTTLASRLNADQVKLWRRQVLLPVLLMAAGLHAIGLLDDLLALGIRIRDERITVGAILLGLGVMLLFTVFSRGSRRFLETSFLPQAGAEPALTQLVATLVAYAILIAGLLAALSLMGVSLTALAVVAGGLSVGIGFGLQEIVSNLISGFILLLERSIGPGDVVQEGNTIGIVEEIGIRSMRLRTPDNIELIVPNARFLTETVTNFTRSEARVRVHIPVGVSYQAEPREVEQALLEAASAPGVLAEPAPSVLFADFGESSLDFELLVWTDDPFEIPGLTSRLRYRIWQALADRQIEIPFPQRDVHIRTVAAPAGSPGSASLM